MEGLQKIQIAGTVDKLNSTSLNAFVKGIDGLTLSQAQAALSTRALTDAQKEQILTSANLLKTKEALGLEEVKQMASSMSLSAQKKEEILTTLQGAIVENEWNEERLEAIVATGGEAGAIAQAILAKKAENVENVKNIAGRKALTASLWEELKARLALMAINPAVWIAGIIGAGIGLVALQQKTSKSLDECVDGLEEYNSAFESTQSKVESLDTELNTCRNRIKELQELANNGTISIIEQEELDRLKETNEELDRNLRIQKEKAQLSAIEGAKSADETLSKTVESKYITSLQDFSGVGVATEYASWVTPEKELEAAISEYNRLSMEIDKLNELYDSGTISEGDYEKQLSDLTSQQTNARTRASEISGILVEAEQAYTNLINTGGKLTTTQQDNYNSVSAANVKYYEFLGTLSQANSVLSETANTTESIVASTKEFTPLSITETVDQIDNQLKPALDSLGEAYKTIFEDTFNLENVDTVGLVKDVKDELAEAGITIDNTAYEDFVKVLSDTSSTVDDVKTAFNELATAITGVSISGIEDFDVLKKSLSDLGVVNNVEVAFASLARNTEALYAAGLDLSTATQQEIADFAAQYVSAENLSQAIQYLTYQKMLNKMVDMDTTEEVSNLLVLAKNAGITGEAISHLTELEILYQEISSGTLNADMLAEYQARADELVTLIKSASTEFKPKVKYTPTIDTSGLKKSTTKDTKETFDWIETIISRIQRTITNLGKTVSATYKKWSIRNNALAQEMSAINQEIATQQQAYDAYMKKANSVNLSEHYKELVRNGGLRVEDIADEGLKENIKNYEEWYDKALSCSDAIQDLQDSLAELAKTKFENISKEYDDRIAMIEHHTSMLEGYVNRAEAAGFWASEIYYQKMAEKELENINQLQDKYNDLTNTLSQNVANGSIEQYSEDWYEMRIQIDDVEQALQEANTQLIEFNQTLQQIHWDLFDRADDYKNDFIDESNFLAEILSMRDLYNDIGRFTTDGLAVQGLHAVNYNAYMEKSEALAEEILKLNKEIANDPNDLELMDRRNELIELQQDAIKNAMSEKDAIKDLVSNGYDVMLDSLEELVNKRREALNAERDLFNYQNSIKEKTDTISSYQKQLQAYNGDNSEEAKATIQKLQVSLAEAEKDLQETEYEKYISDQESLLDSLYNQTEQWVNTRLDNIDGLVSEAIQATNDSAITIGAVITETAETIGYTLSEYANMLWSGDNDNTTLLLKSYENVGLGMDVGVTRLENVLNSIDQKIQTMVNDLNNQATVESESIGQPDIEYNETNNYDTGSYEPQQSTSNGITFNGGTFYEDSYKGGKTGNSKNQWTGHEVEVTHESGTGMVHIIDKTTGTVLGWVDKDQLQGYATGTTNAKKGFNLVSEKGDELIKDKEGNIILAKGEQIFPFKGGETVFNADKTAELLNGNLMPLSAEQLWGNIIKTPRLPEMVNKGVGGSVANDIQLNIAVKANNYDEFVTSFKTAIKSDPQCRKLIQAVTIDEAVGRGGLRRNNF